MLQNILSPLLITFIQQAPLYLVWLIGIVIALVKWRSHPRLSLLVLLTLVCFAIVLMLEGLIDLFGPQFAVSNHLSFIQLENVYIIIGFASSLLNAALWGLIFWAIFGKSIRSV